MLSCQDWRLRGTRRRLGEWCVNRFEVSDQFCHRLVAGVRIHAEPGQILASNVVRELAAGKDFLFSDLGETELRGFEDPVKLWELRWQE